MPPVLKALARTSRVLAEFKGLAESLPNQEILLNTLAIQEAKDSSEIENIVTTHDELFNQKATQSPTQNLAAKEVLRYREAMQLGHQRLLAHGLITNNDIISIQATLEKNNAGFRKVPGTTLRNNLGEVVYTPPQDANEIVRLMGELEQFINDDDAYAVDPLIKMALIHHQFESIHPFYDGNGRTGRIINVLYLVKHGLLNLPVLYMSRAIVRRKAEYYQGLQTARSHDAWEAWVIYMLNAVEASAADGIITLKAIRSLWHDLKQRLRATHKFYSQDLLNNLFNHPYTKIEFIERDLHVSRLTATQYLEAMTDTGFLTRRKVGRNVLFINHALHDVLVDVGER